MNKLITQLIALLLVVFSTNLAAQNYKPNSVYFNVGTVVFLNQASLSAEHTLFSINKARTKIKATVGAYFLDGNDYESGARALKSHLNVSIVQLLSIIELGLGLGTNTYKFDRGITFGPPSEPPEYYNKLRLGFHLYGNVGLRVEKNEYLFRAGLGYPELLYIGAGYNF